MKYNTIFISFLICFFSFNCAASVYSDRDVQSVLSKLDYEIGRRQIYKQKREAHIDSLKTARNADEPGTSKWFDHTMKIAIAYNAFNNDSSLMYYTDGLNRAVEMKNDSLETEFRLRRATYLSVSGFINDAINEYKMIDTTSMSPTMLQTYYSSSRQMFSYISNFYDGFISTYDYWNNMAIEAQQRLLPLLPPNSIDYKLNLGEYYYNCREYAKGRKILSELVNQIPQTTSQYAIACHILASIANTRGDRNEYLYYLALSAIADTKMATLEIMSLQELGGVLFEMNDTKRAHVYLTVAMNNAVESRASVRMMRTTELLNVVEKDHLSQISRWRTRVYVVIAALVVCLLALIVAVWYLFRQLTRVALMQQSLQSANKTKDVYISQFLSLCSVYMDKLKQFCKLANRKISAGQVDELYKITKSGKFIEEQSREFYSVFDDAFLHIYPSFVDKVNELLRPEERVVLAEGELMNSDLRILAFMRLGIDDANRVAQILNYSVNTIYAYRNKLRNRAINRETFEADIMAIDSI